MANVLNTDKKIAVIGALAEGSSIRSIERITGVHRDTVMRLGVRVGKGCAALMDAKMRDLGCRYLEFDEIWSHNTDDPENPKRHVAVLHAHPIKSAQDAVKAAIVQEFRNLAPEEN